MISRKMKQKQVRLKIHKILKETLISSYDKGNIEDGGILNGLECSKQIISYIENNCYGIIMSTGSWDDHHSWIEYVCFDEKEANAFAETYNKKLNKLKERLDNELPKDEFNDIDFSNIPNEYRYHNIYERNNCIVQKLKLL